MEAADAAVTRSVTAAFYIGGVAKILIFRTNTDTKIPANRLQALLDGKIFNLASERRDVVINRDHKAVALSFPEAWRPFVVLPSVQFTHR